MHRGISNAHDYLRESTMALHKNSEFIIPFYSIRHFLYNIKCLMKTNIRHPFKMQGPQYNCMQIILSNLV